MNKSEYNKKYYGEHREEILAKQKEYRKKNRTAILKREKELRKKNKDRIRASKKRYYKANRERELARNKTYQEAHKEEMRAYKKQWDEENKEKNKEYQRQYYLEHLEEKRVYKRKHYQENKEKINRYNKRRYHSDINYKLACSQRRRLVNALRNNQKTGSAIKDLGCSVENLRKHLENLFRPGMSWRNWGRFGWHIDHVIPLSRFALDDTEQFLQAVHYTNLQPMWANDNLSKGNN